MSDNSRDTIPPIAWPLRRRVKFFGGTGLVCGGIVLAIELLIADIPGERAFNKLSPGGEVPLWPSIRVVATFAVAGPLAIAISLPLYKRRYGWVAIATLIYLVFMGSALGFQRSVELPLDPVSRLQLAVAIVGIAFMVAMMVRAGLSIAVGQSDDPSSGSPPVT